MEFFPLTNGKKLPEVYHFGFSGTHFQVFLPFTRWSQFVSLAGHGTYYASKQSQSYVQPAVTGGAFGQHGCVSASKTLDGSVCIEVPAFTEKSSDKDQGISMRTLGYTLSNILFTLQHLLYETNGQKEDIEQGISQLFMLESATAREPGFHSAGLGLSLSPLSRRYLEGLGKDTVLEQAVKGMREHYFRLFPDRKEGARPFHGDIAVHLYEHGVLYMHTVGNCACLGTMPRNFGDNEGYHLSSHNVDSVSQQFNLLVGVAYVWQMVRDGVYAQT